MSFVIIIKSVFSTAFIEHILTESLNKAISPKLYPVSKVNNYSFLLF